MQLLQWRLSSPKAATHLPGFLVFREARSRKLDTTAEHQAAFDDEENLTKEVEKYNQSIIERRAVRYEAFLRTLRLDRVPSSNSKTQRSPAHICSLDQKAYVPGSCVFHLSNAAEQAGLYKDFFWDNPGFWFGLFSDELMEMFAHTRQTFADDYWSACGNNHTDLGSNAHRSNEDQKEQALIAPQDDVEVYERMSLFKAVVEIAVEAQKAYLVFEDNLSEDDLSEDD